MSSLIVVLPLPTPGAAPSFATPGAAWEYALASSDGQRVTQHASAPLAALPARGRGVVEIVALVPAAMLSWHQVDLPKGTLNRQGAGSPRLRAVLDGLLEDRLLDEPEQLHFALEPGARVGAPSWVAVCDRHWLRSALQALEDAGRAAVRIVPEFAPGSDALYAVGSAELPLLACVDARGVRVVPLGSATLALAFGGASPPAEVPLFAEPAVTQLAEEVLARPPTLQSAPERWLEAARSAWDLAQFGLQSSGRGRALRKAGGATREWLNAPRWRAARWGVALLLLTQLIGINAWAWRERAGLGAKRQAVNTVLTETFPGVQVVVDAPLQMERELSVLRQTAGAPSGRDFEALLSSTSQALAQVAPQGPLPNGIEFTGGELRLKGLTLTAPQVAALADRLRGAGLSARIDADALLVSAQNGVADATGARP